ncbi:hypothetical protein SteCoe_890 [Stentor coeruleus]|uniref:Uncharacterized protein n=1 Tax=Stentor coeruleus TaxID=5963 RepID=A0A1R2D2Z4_9CILI|nr:hypothetical protein SteCoe_890 [Stentor coeruleus]
MNVWELLIVLLIQLIQIPYFFFSLFTSILYLSKLITSTIILILFMCLYFLERKANFINLKISIVLTYAIIILKLFSVVLFSGPSSCSICEFYCMMNCFIEGVPEFAGVMILISDGFVLSAAIVINARCREERAGKQRFIEVERIKTPVSASNEGTPRAHKVMADLIQETIVSSSLGRHPLRNPRMFLDANEKEEENKNNTQKTGNESDPPMNHTSASPRSNDDQEFFQLLN